MSDLSTVNFETLSTSEFETILPDLFASGNNVSQDPRLQAFFGTNPDAAALVKDLESIAATAKQLFEPIHEPSDDLWSSIASKLGSETQPGGEAVDLFE